MLKETTKKPANIMSLRSRDVAIEDKLGNSKGQSRKITKSQSASSTVEPTHKPIRKTRSSRDSVKENYSSPHKKTIPVVKNSQQQRKKSKSRASSYDSKSPRTTRQLRKTPSMSPKTQPDKNAYRSSSLVRAKGAPAKRTARKLSSSRKRSGSKVGRNQSNKTQTPSNVVRRPPKDAVSHQDFSQQTHAYGIAKGERIQTTPRRRALSPLLRSKQLPLDDLDSVTLSDTEFRSRTKKTTPVDINEKTVGRQRTREVHAQNVMFHLILMSLRVFMYFMIIAVIVAVALLSYFQIQKKSPRFKSLKKLFEKNL